jgi:hypothetical protein
LGSFGIFFSWISVLVLAITGSLHSRAHQGFREHPVKSESHEGHNQPSQDSASQTSALSDLTSIANEKSQALKIEGANTDKDLKKKLILIAVVFVLALVFYMIASPYQNCMRTSTSDRSGFCSSNTSW